MADKEENTSFLIRTIPRDLWGKVKHRAFDRGLSVRAYIIDLLERDTVSWRIKMETEKKQKEDLPSI